MRPSENPFRMSQLERLRFRADSFCHDRFLQRAASHGYRGAIVGPHGSGKSTLLAELRPALEREGYRVCPLFINADRERGSLAALLAALGPVDERCIILFDGGCHLSWLEWHWFQVRTRKAAGVLITAHEDGRLPTLHRADTSLALFQELYDELSESTAVAPDLGPLFHEAQGNLRQALRECYWHAAGRDRSFS